MKYKLFNLTLNIANLFQRKKQTIAIAAIFRNEKEYIIEWLAWHISQGIENFIIIDNESDDGTTELLQQLAAKNLITLHSIPHQKKVQLVAYNQILKQYRNTYELIAFIDADEFLMPMDEQLAATHITNLFQDKNIGALAINWKIFGTSGHQSKVEGHILTNFTLAANDAQPRNHYIKSICRSAAVAQVFVHHITLKKGYRYINAASKDIAFSEWANNNLSTPTKNNEPCGVSSSICNESLRVNHYALKSVEEFITKKKYKGNSMAGKDNIKGDGYFKAFDLNDEKVTISANHLLAFNTQYTKLLSILK